MNKTEELIATTTEARSGIRLLACFIHAQHNGKLPMQECLTIAEGLDTEALIVDSEQVRKWAEHAEQIDRQATPQTKTIM